MKDYNVSLRTMQVRVKKQAERLDPVLPSWFRLIDLRTFDVGSSAKCVVGQLRNALKMTDDEVANFIGDLYSSEHGFAWYGGDWDRLTALWKHQIKKRLKVRP